MTSFRPLAGISCLHELMVETYKRCVFPSPRGDKLHHLYYTDIMSAANGFRPLAGISCITINYDTFFEYCEFPSPRGDKLHRWRQNMASKWFNEFPSPRGDKLHPNATFVEELAESFPSPRGDKLHRPMPKRQVKSASFRPLAGISCIQARRGLRSRQTVSVPSRG